MAPRPPRTRTPRTPAWAGGSSRQKLNQARILAGDTRRVGPVNWDAFAGYLEAAIVFGRSVIDHLSKEYTGYADVNRKAFTKWHASQELRMDSGHPGADPLLAYFRDTRNVVVHEHAAPLGRQTQLFVAANALLVLPWRTKLVRLRAAVPRGPSAIVREVRSWRGRTPTPQRSPVLAPPEHRAFFDDPLLRNRPAEEVVDQYLDLIESIVTDAEQRFPPPTT